MKFIDTHMHLDSERYEGEINLIVERAEKAGAKFIISSGINPPSNRKVLELSKKYNLVKCSFGLYPVDSILNKIKHLELDIPRYVEEFDPDKELEWIEENKDFCVAIGEIGLDYKIIPGTEDLQKEVFIKALRLAKKLDKVVVIHSRKAEEDVIDIMEEEGMKKVMMHCFSGKKKLIRRCVDLGWSFSVPAVIKRLDHFKMLVEMVPLEQLLTETDSPYLSLEGGTRNEPSNIPITINIISEIKEIKKEEVEEKLLKNAEDLFEL